MPIRPPYRDREREPFDIHAYRQCQLPTVLQQKVPTQSNAPIFHIVREYRFDGSDIEKFRYDDFMDGNKYAVPGSPGCAVVKGLEPFEGEYKIVKHRFSGFMKTGLEFMLRRLRVTDIVVAGIQYPNCIRATVFDAVAYGFDVSVWTDATSAKSEEIAQANIIDLINIRVKCIKSSDLSI